MNQGQRRKLADKYRSFLLLLLILISFSGYAQTWNPSIHVTINDALGQSQAAPIDGRTMLWDGNNFIYRAFASTSEVLSYLPTNASRFGNSIIVVDSGGTLQSNGIFLNPHNTFYMFADSTTNGGLKKLNLFSTGGCAGCLLAANNLSDLASATAARTNLGLAAMATLNSTAGGDLSGTWPLITVAKFNGQLPSYYLNYANLTNTPAPLALTTSGSSGAATYNSGTGVLNIPIYGGGSGGYCLNCNADTIANIPITLGPIRNNYVLTLDSAGGYFYLAPGGGSSGGGTVTSVAMTVPSSLLAVSGSPINSTGTFAVTLANASAYNVFGNGTNATATPGYFTPNATILNSWFGGTIQSQLTLTTTGTSGAATLTGSTLNIPQYAGSVQNLTYTQLAANNTLAISGGNTVTFLTATELLAGLLDTSRAKLIDSLHNRTFIVSPDTIHVLQAGAGISMGYTNTAGSILYLKGGESSTTNSIVTNSDSSFSVNSLLAGSNSISISGTAVSFLNDAATPGAWFLYGPNGSSVKGWNNFTAYPVTTLGANGLFSSAEKARLDSTIVEVNALQYPTLDSLVTVNVAQDTLTYKRLEFIAGTGISIADNGNLYKNSYTITNTGGGGSGSVIAGPGIYVNGGDTVAVDSVWHRKGKAINGTGIGEASTIWDGNSVSFPGDSVVKMFYSDALTEILYTESTDGLHFSAGTPIITNHFRNSVQKKGDSIIVFCANAAQTQIDRYAAIEGSTSFTLTNSAVVVYNTAPWNAGGVFNSWPIQIGSTYYLQVDGLSSKGFLDGLYTSTDDVHFTAYSGNPTINIVAPYIRQLGDTTWLWGHKSPFVPGSSSTTPVTIFRAYSLDTMKHWIRNPFTSTFPPVTAGEGLHNINGQLSDMTMADFGGKTYIYSTATPNGNNAPTGYPILEVAVANMTIDSLVHTNENAYINTPLLSLDTTTKDTVQRIDFAQMDGHFSVGDFPSDSVLFWIGAGTAHVSPFGFDLYDGTRFRSNPYPGVLEAHGIYIRYTDSLKNLDTLVDRLYTRQQLAALGLQNVLTNNPFISQNDTIQNPSGYNFVLNGGTFYASNMALPSGSTTSTLNLNSGQLLSQNSTTQPNVVLGNLLLQSVANNDAIIGMNLYLNGGSWTYYSSGPGSGIQMASNNVYFVNAGSGTGGTGATVNYSLILNSSNNASFNSFDNSNAQVQSTSTSQAQYGLYHGSGTALLNVGSSGILAFQLLTGVTLPTSAIPAGSGSDTALVIETSGGIATIKKALISGGGGGDAITSPNSTLTVGGSSSATTLDLNLAHSNTFTAVQGTTLTSLGTTVTDGYELYNTTAAASGAQQISPAIHLRGQGWPTTPATSQPVDAWIYMLPVQGTTIPGATLVFALSQDGGSITNVLTLNDGGGASVSGNISSTTNFIAGTTGGYTWTGGTTPGLYTDSAYSFSARQGTHAEEFRLMNTYTAVGNQGFFRISHQVSANTVTIGPYSYGAAPTEGVTAVGAWTFNGTVLTQGTLASNVLVGNGGVLSAAAGTGAGTSPSITMLGSGISGKVSVTTGSSPSGSNAVIVTVTLNNAYPNNPVVLLFPGNPAAAALTGITAVYANGASTTTWTITSGSSALSASTNYVWNYLIPGY